MTAKQIPGNAAPDGAHYVTLTDGAGNLAPAGSGTNLSEITDGTNGIVAVKPASTAPLATDISLVTTLSPNSPGIVALGQTTKSASVPVTLASDQSPLPVSTSSSYPVGATAITASSGNVAAATATATLAGTSSKTTYISGFSVVGSGATVGAVVIITITNLIGSVTFSYPLAAIAGAVLMNTPLIVNFTIPIPANATNTSIVVSCPSLGTGNTNNVVNAYGYQL